jgi:DNA-binding NarL/FixJ family response regulator
MTGVIEMNVIRIVVADDHQLVRAGICALLKSVAGVEVVAEASDGREACRLAETVRPQIILMDIMMPGLNGLGATERITKEFPHTRVIILSMNASEEYVLEALRSGASGYLLKNVSPAELEMAIKAVTRGDTYLSSAISKQVIDSYLQRAGGSVALPERLTPRQREVLQLIAEGNTTKEMARKLILSVKTVEMHRAQLMETLDIHEIAGLVRYAIRIGLISLDR